MTNLFISLLFPLMMAATPSDSTRINQDPVFDKENCTFNGIPLYGRVRIVDASEDFKVKVVEHFEDIRVEKTEYPPDECGEWRFVEASEDFRIRIVEYGEDFTISFVDAFPGIR